MPGVAASAGGPVSKAPRRAQTPRGKRHAGGTSAAAAATFLTGTPQPRSGCPEAEFREWVVEQFGKISVEFNLMGEVSDGLQTELTKASGGIARNRCEIDKLRGEMNTEFHQVRTSVEKLREHCREEHGHTERRFEAIGQDGAKLQQTVENLEQSMKVVKNLVDAARLDTIRGDLNQVMKETESAFVEVQRVANEFSGHVEGGFAKLAESVATIGKATATATPTATATASPTTTGASSTPSPSRMIEEQVKQLNKTTAILEDKLNNMTSSSSTTAPPGISPQESQGPHDPQAPQVVQ